MEWKTHMVKITFCSLFFWINSVSGMVRAEIRNLVGKPPSLRRSAFEGTSENWFWFEWVLSLWKSYFVHIHCSGCDFGGLFSNMWNIGRLWRRRHAYPYIEIFSHHARWIQRGALVSCAEDKTRSICSACILFSMKTWLGRWGAMNPLKIRIWGYCANPLLCSSCCSLCAGTAVTALVHCLYWILQPSVLDKYRFVAPAYAYPSIIFSP